LAHAVRDDATGDSLSQYLAEIGRAPLLTPAEEVELARAIEAGREAARALEAALTPTERRRLRELVDEGAAARDRFLESNLRLVVSIAKRYRNGVPGLDLLDLIQEGNLGLVRAVEKYDWRKGFKFSTYATWWIRQAVQRALLEKGRPVRVPPRVHDAVVTLRSIGDQVHAEGGRRPTPAELAEHSGIDIALVEEALAVSGVTSLEAPVGEDGAVVGDFVELAGDEDPEESALTADVSRELREAIDRLGEREQLIMLHRFGFHDDVPRTRAEIGELLGISAERVHQLEKAALCRLRHPAFGLRERDLL
jgi:RNA polymerase sigma factor (sigma-70 family)